MYQLITFGIAALLVLAILLFCRKAKDNRFHLILKVLAVAFYTVGFFRLMLSDTFIFVINGAWFEQVRYEQTDFLQSVIRWGFAINYATLLVAVFYESRFFKNIACFVGLPFSILTTLYFNQHMAYFLEENKTYDRYMLVFLKELSQAIKSAPAFRYAFFILELVLALSIPLLLMTRQKHFIRLRDKKEVGSFLLGIPLVLLVSMPVYIPQSFFGYDTLIAAAYSNYHLIWLGLILLFSVGLYYAFRFKPRAERLALCMFLAFTLFYTRNSIYLMGLNISRLPFQLCNIATYFYLIALIFNRQKMFHFAFVANIVGALIAILMPDFSVGFLSFWNMHYLIEHSLVVLVPAMVMGLRIFPRLTIKSLKYIFIGFTIYFVCIFVGGVILNGYSDVTKESINYFYMFDLEKAADFLPPLERLEVFTLEFGRFSFNPILVGLIYVMFSLLCFLFYLLIQFCYKMEDDHLALRLSSIDLYEKITKKTSRRPKQFIE